jgi:predicted RNase H-related nuclease YkuK (DUF458 family)
MTSNRWLNSRGEVVSFDSVLSEVSREGAEIHIGSDSHLIGGKWIFATALCVYFPRMGGTFFYQKSKFQREEFRTLYDRIMKETTLSILTAEEIKEHMSVDIVIHSDVAICDTESAKYHSLVKGYVSAMGYEILVKPNAWASSSVADKVSR